MTFARDDENLEQEPDARDRRVRPVGLRDMLDEQIEIKASLLFIVTFDEKFILDINLSECDVEPKNPRWRGCLASVPAAFACCVRASGWLDSRRGRSGMCEASCSTGQLGFKINSMWFCEIHALTRGRLKN
ncbi:hypothetical protein [Streptomyces stackebrandtii]|uniref:hypothetical protein n=1 Tax=Streptomyces stackebrandtii TaxID=3051177 RepID=UPI0028DC164E|nr:hypothetical protein [Streptomyces sp. DSM 40976]